MNAYEKRIHDYLNGDLSPEEEQQLFSGLSENPEWREELALQRKIHEAAQRDLASTSIPSTTTTQIFSTLGYRTPRVASLIQSASSLVRFATIACVGGVLAISGFYLWPGPTQTVQKKVQAISTISQPTVSVVEAPSEMPALPLPYISNSKEKSLLKSQEVHRAIPNEPYLHLDIGKFTSVDYLTQQKIIGVADKGRIYYSSNGGTSWILQASATTADLLGVNFIDTLTGVVVGARGTALVTSNAGADWAIIPTTTIADLITVRYVTHDTAFACGASGTVLRSITSGRSWQQQTTPTDVRLFKIQFVDKMKGIVRGENGLTIHTENAGESWQQ